MYWRLTSVIWIFGMPRHVVYKVDCIMQSIKVVPRLPVLFTGFGELFYFKMNNDINQSKYTFMSCHREMPVGERVSGHIFGMGLIKKISRVVDVTNCE